MITSDTVLRRPPEDCSCWHLGAPESVGIVRCGGLHSSGMLGAGLTMPEARPRARQF